MRFVSSQRLLNPQWDDESLTTREREAARLSHLRVEFDLGELIRSGRVVDAIIAIAERDDRAPFAFYHEAWTMIPEDQRAPCVIALWTHTAEWTPSVRRCLEIFGTAPTLRKTVPPLAKEVKVYAGVRASNRRRAHAKIRHVAWSRDFGSAEGFAYGGPQLRQFVGTTVISREEIPRMY